MNCPDKQLLQELVDSELEKGLASEVMGHIKSCSKCKDDFRQILTVYNALSETVDESPCPSSDALEKCVQKMLSTDEANKIQEHIDFCSRCDSYVWLFSASETELADWQAKEELAYRKFRSKNLGYDVAKETLKKLLPGKIEIFDKVWGSILSLVLDLKDKAAEQWPSFSSPGQLVGALGFSEMTDPESTATSIILATTLLVSQEIADGQIETTPQAIEAAVKETAAKFGAGRELQKRLIEIVPKIILSSHS